MRMAIAKIETKRILAHLMRLGKSQISMERPAIVKSTITVVVPLSEERETTARCVDPDCSITVVSDEDMPAYSRVLTPYLISGEVENIFIRTPEYYRELNVQTLLGRRAEKLEAGNLILEGGETLAFNRLLTATGSAAAVPGIT